MRQEIVNGIKKDYNRKRLQATEDLKIRQNEIYDMLPRIKEIDQEIARLSIKISRIILTKPEHLQDQIDVIREKIDIFKEEKKYILKKRGVPDIYLQEVYYCHQCNDTGYTAGGNMCSCYKQSLINELYNISSLGNLLQKENFDTFDLSKFDDIAYGKEKLTPKENIKVILKHALEFVDTFHKRDRNLLFYGGTGLGKTFMCNCIAKDLMDKGIIVLYQSSFKMFETISEHKFNRNLESYDNKDNFGLIYESDLLIIDDLGAESINSFTITELFNIINTRLITDKKTIISTNLSLEKLSEAYSDRIFSRLMSQYDIFKFYGKDIRTKRG
ncbi:MAG: ATP-binding protein [Eubacteriales bacterium]|nr:ATP-binding protein [Eubacteriales bacterium]